MAARNNQVIDFVREELRKDPGLGSRALYDRAQRVDSTIASESLRQFHGRYVLPIKRERVRGGRKGRSGTAKVVAATAAAKSTRSAPPSRGRAPVVKQAPTKRTPVRDDGNSGRDAIRRTLIRFAQEVVSAAESPSRMVDVMGNMEKYVEEVIRRAR